LKTEQAVNEIRLTLTHFIVWWMALYYYPGGQGEEELFVFLLFFIFVLIFFPSFFLFFWFLAIYSVATVCLFYLGTLLCAFSQGQLIQLKMGLWIVLVFTNFGRLGFSLWHGCSFPTALLTVSPPYDINSNVHMMMFCFFSYLPVGFVFHYFLYGRGSLCNWYYITIFFVYAHWPNSKEETRFRIAIPTSALSTSKLLQKEPPRKKKEGKESSSSTKELSKKSLAGNNVMLRKCSYYLCSHYETRSKEFKVCARCRAPFCSRECHLKDWNDGNHKSYCKSKKGRT
jgi:hypothetical protein